jgi:hypothetical protein
MDSVLQQGDSEVLRECKLDKSVLLVTCIREIPGSNIDQEN